MSIFRQKVSEIASPLLIVFAFALPLSTSAGSILAILLILCWFITGGLKEKITEILHNPVTIAVLVYVLLHIIGLLWTDDLKWGLEILRKQWKLLLFPIFLSIARKEHSNYYMAAFTAAIFLKASKAYLVWLGFITLPPSSIFTTVGTSHVSYNPMLALVCYIILQSLLFNTGSKAAHKWLLATLLLFFSFNMFITAGRTGQITFFILLGVALFQYFYNVSKTKLIIGLILLPVLVVGIYQTSPTFKSRADTALAEMKNHKLCEITSVGLRVWFTKNTLLMIKDNLFTGVGTGDYPTEYSKINKRESPNLPDTVNPHNQYLLSTSLFGLLGFSSLISIFISQLIMALTTRDSMTPMRQAFPVFFLAIMLGESYLLSHGTGMLFSLFSAFLYRKFPEQS